MTPQYQDENASIYVGHAIDVLSKLIDNSVYCVVTSPPYWGLRDYKLAPQIWAEEPGCEHEWSTERLPLMVLGRQLPHGDGRPIETDHYAQVREPRKGHQGVIERGFCVRCRAWRGSLGQEPTVELYVQHLVQVFRAVRRILRHDGTLWLNMGDCYQGGNRGRFRKTRGEKSKVQQSNLGSDIIGAPNRFPVPGLKAKDLVGMPWRVALALQADGWYLRSDIIWAKPNPVPESVTDRPTKAHEYVFLLAKTQHYYFDAVAVREPSTKDMLRRSAAGHTRGSGGKLDASRGDHASFRGVEARAITATGHNIRTVWTFPTQAFRGAHFATYPEKLVEPCVKAGCPLGETVMDPFCGSGTTGAVATRLYRKFIGIELNPDYARLAERRIREAASASEDGDNG